MNVLEKTRELGEALYNSPEYQAVKEAQAVMEADETASHILKELSELEAAYVLFQSLSKNSTKPLSFRCICSSFIL